MPKLDRWLLTKLNELIEKAEQSYCDYEFHIITHAVNDFCVNTLSSFYLDIVKDRLYCEGADSAVPPQRADRAVPHAPHAFQALCADPRFHLRRDLARHAAHRR